ncbi:MAG TPA: DNA-formamidopyrimidine glycosylase family protein [Solirubrobacteraceae bacterium]|jgi:formamidopyrimidine-DNA glycosylase
MPELPEVEITARRLDAALRGARIESALAPGINALKTFDPPLSALADSEIAGVGRRGKHLVVEVRTASGVGAGGKSDAGPASRARAAGDELALLIHLMSAGRLQLFDKHAGPRDRTSRVLLRIADGRELRLREFGSKQAAWAKLLPAMELAQDESLAKLGPEAWPDPPELGELLAASRPLHTVLRDQHVIAGIGRSWVDEILWQAQLSPYKRGGDLQDDEPQRLRAAIIAVLGGAIDHYENEVTLPIPDKLPMPLQVHRHEDQPCPRCQTTLRAVHFEDYVIAYCPTCQTEGRVLKDRRLSRLLK